jgi:hypothetical protein
MVRTISTGEYDCDHCPETVDGWVATVNHLTEYHTDNIDPRMSVGELVEANTTELRERV